MCVILTSLLSHEPLLRFSIINLFFWTSSGDKCSLLQQTSHTERKGNFWFVATNTQIGVKEKIKAWFLLFFCFKIYVVGTYKNHFSEAVLTRICMSSWSILENYSSQHPVICSTLESLKVISLYTDSKTTDRTVSKGWKC